MLRDIYMFSLLERFKAATNPLQYDSSEISWESEADPEAPYRKFFWEYLRPYQLEWRRKTILEIGSGAGWFLRKVQDAHPKKVVGIEPGIKNAALIRTHLPSIELYNQSLEEFETNETFDVIVSVMVFSHIADLARAFKKVHTLLAQKGRVYLIIPDFEYNRTPRFGYALDIQPVHTEEYVVTVVGRGQGTLSDVMRSTNCYLRAATEAGLDLAQHEFVKPTDELIRVMPKYEPFRGTCMAHVLVFEKKLERHRNVQNVDR
jgi:SAM-dependent methyltransferase